MKTTSKLLSLGALLAAGACAPTIWADTLAVVCKSDFNLALVDPATQKQWVDWAPFSYPFNLTRQPAASVPCGFTKTGLPIGLQIVGRMYDEPLVLRAAQAFERAQPFARCPID